MDVEVEAPEGFGPPRGGGVGDEEVRTEGDETAHRVGLVLEDRAVEVPRGAPPAPGRPEGALVDPERRGGRGRKLGARDIAHRHGRKLDVAAPPAVAPGERVEERDRPVGLGRVGVLPDPGPRVVGDRARLPEEARGLAHLACRNAGDPLHSLRRILATEVAVAREGRPAGHLPRHRLHPARAFERPLATGSGRRPRIDHLRRPVARAPRDRMAGVAARHEVRGGEQPAAPPAGARLRALVHHQKGSVRPVPQEVAVVPPLLDHHPRDAEGERSVGSRPHPQPLVRLRRDPRPARIDDDEPRPPRLRLVHPLPLREPRAGRIVTPEEHAAGGVEIRGPDPGAERVAGGVVLVPVADLGAVDVVGGPERVQQPLDPRQRIGDGGPAWGGDRERHPLGTVRLHDSPQLLGREIERLVPADSHPSGVRVALGACPAERVQDPVGAVDEVRGGLALRAEGAPGGMVRVPLDRHEAPLPHHGDAATARPTKSAPAGNPAFEALGPFGSLDFRGSVGSHVVTLLPPGNRARCHGPAPAREPRCCPTSAVRATPMGRRRTVANRGRFRHDPEPHRHPPRFRGAR